MALLKRIRAKIRGKCARRKVEKRRKKDIAVFRERLEDFRKLYEKLCAEGDTSRAREANNHIKLLIRSLNAFKTAARRTGNKRREQEAKELIQDGIRRKAIVAQLIKKIEAVKRTRKFRQN